ncbi:MAG: hypothetical protein NTU76_03445 [Candidatus Taylorbacteria bacterium]|nr:hypothetical protein [Candidatus Taylorbacteria bacterium]
MSKLWFKRKTYGWGWVPSSWEGWFVVITKKVKSQNGSGEKRNSISIKYGYEYKIGDDFG